MNSMQCDGEVDNMEGVHDRVQRIFLCVVFSDDSLHC